MPLKGRSHPPTKLYQQDTVRRIGPNQSLGIVLRCWHDAEDVSPHTALNDPMMRPLRPGEVGVSFLVNGGEREILPESELRLIDRSIQPGDFCKKSIDDVQSGVVTNVLVKGRIEHVISGEPVEGWKTLDDVQTRLDAEIGDYVIYDDWIGQVIELFDESLIEISTGQLVRLPELSSRLSIGEKGNEIIPPPTGSMYNLFGSFFSAGGSRPDSVDTVIDVEHTVYAIAWLAVSQMIDSATAETKTRPQKFWSGKDIGKLTLIRGRSDLEMRVGDRVRPRNNTGTPFTRHRRDDANALFEVHLFIVTETETTLDVLWQDGTKESVRSTEVIPYLNPDEYDSWPGDHVFWKSEENRRHAIVQSVNAIDRTAKVLLPDTNTIEVVSVLELDPYGTSDPSAAFPPSGSDGLGVCRGDFVFVHPSGATNGFEKPVVPKIGEVEPWVRENPIVDGQLGGWRKEMADVGTVIAARRATEGVRESSAIVHPVQGSGNFTWIGEVIGLKLDGTIEVAHPDSTVEIYPLERLTKLHDGMEQLENALWGDGGDSYDGHSGDEGEEIWSMDEDGVWQPDLNGGDWEDENDEMQLVEDDSIEVVSGGWADESMENSADKPEIPTPEVPLAQNTRLPALEDPGPTDKCAVETTLTWDRFEILSSAPLDHAFISSPPAQPSKSFLSRLTKEYRVLSSSLPDTIIVRAYEDRADLLRSLIIGPENTPYEDAPMMIDWKLDSNFPHSPPVAHFHSWTNGNGRVNPNLYEEGKVCLSILGTWSGDRDEIWSAARSSLLQAFVSIQGLVLVKEPWFCEPAYDKLRGTEEGIVNSRLYSEKAYVLSRAFVRRALEVPLGSLDSEIKWLYYGNHRLDKVLRDARALIKKSTASQVNDADQELAVPRLTTGGIITLERTLSKLQVLLDNNRT
ncbi:putative ubiquitin-conjugating enzyme E2 23 [Termitomyces sp. J132]|nr:putative ubiquitin-conjugating enzyme E2 23 [Termitomyces sp. J132]